MRANEMLRVCVSSIDVFFVFSCISIFVCVLLITTPCVLGRDKEETALVERRRPRLI
jgi:hypothetical protein